MSKTWNIDGAQLVPDVIATRDVQALHARAQDNGIDLTYPELVMQVMVARDPKKELNSLSKDLDGIEQERQLQNLAQSRLESFERYQQVNRVVDDTLSKVAGGINIDAIKVINDKGEEKIPLLRVDAVADVESSPHGAFSKPSNANRDSNKTLEKFLTVEDDGIA